MRILIIMLARVNGGVENMALYYHQALMNAGHDVRGMGHARGVLAANLPADRFFAANALFDNDPFVAWKLRRTVDTFRPDLILTFGNRATGIALSPLLGLRSRVVQVVQNFRHKSELRHARAAICASAAIAETVAERQPELLRFTVPNFAPLPVHAVKPKPEGAPVMGTLARLHVNKGLDICLEAMAMLKAEGIDFRLKFAGTGPLREELGALAEKLGVADRVEFLGWVDPGQYLGTLDLFLLPSRVEPFGVVVPEAMAAGAPVISTRIDGPREILREGELGLLCDNKDPKALANAIRTALSDWDVTLDRARAAQAYALETFSLAAGQARLSDVLRQITPILATGS